MPPHFTEEQRREICALYQQRMVLTALAKRFCCTRYAISQVLKEGGVKFRSQGRIRKRTAEHVAAEAYQVLGVLADATGTWDFPDMQRALDHFSTGWKDTSKEILPFKFGSR